MRTRLLISGALALAVATAAYAQATLQHKLTPGKVTTIANQKVHQILNIGGMEFPVDVEVVSTSTATTAPRAADGTVHVTNHTDGMKMKLTSPNGGLDYDSARAENKADNQMFQSVIDGFKAYVGTEYTLVYDKDSKLTAVEGTDKIFAAIPADAQAQFKSQLDPERMKKEAKRDAGVLPDGPVKMGDRWKRSEEHDLGSGQKLFMEVYYEYMGTVEKGGKTYDKIGLFIESVKFGLDEDSPIPLKYVSGDLKVDSSTGTILFDRELGAVVESTTSIRISGSLVFNANGMDLPAKLDLTMEGQTTQKR